MADSEGSIRFTQVVVEVFCPSKDSPFWDNICRTEIEQLVVNEGWIEYNGSDERYTVQPSFLCSLVKRAEVPWVLPEWSRRPR